MNVDKLNEIYESLYHRAMTIYNLMKLKGISVEWGWYAFHESKINHEYVTNFYPIPFITVKGICNIVIELNSISIESKISREAFSFDFGIIPFKFEVYGIEDYLNDFHNDKTDIKNIHNRILDSNENEVGITFLFGLDVIPEVILEAVEFCKVNNMYLFEG
jgi:hypothetical protein